MSFQRVLYNAVLPLSVAAARVAGCFDPKIAEGIKGRKGFRERWTNKSSGLNRDGLVFWFHVSSVGEFLQAKPVMDLLSVKFGENLQIALTFFSPSGKNYFEKFDRSYRNRSIRFADYLPFDTVSNMRFCLDAIRPDMVVYTKFDLWPNMIEETALRNVPQILISATLSPGSKRLSGIARGFYGKLYSRLSAIAAISREDALRFEEGVTGDVEIITAGDTRFDQVCQRIDSSTVRLPGGLSSDRRRFIIAGSSWPRDEAIVIPGFKRLHEKHRDSGLIIVPHEPTMSRIEEITVRLDQAGLNHVLLSELEDQAPIKANVVIADGLGYLAELYRTGCIAYVGGSWTTGVHNVMEPAVLGLPVLFGPRIDNSWEAGKLVELGVAKVVKSPEEFAGEAGKLVSDEKLLGILGKKGTGFIRNHCGAAAVCVDLIEHYLKKGKK